MIKKIFWGKRTPRKLVFATGLYTLTNGLVDMMWAPITHNLLERRPANLQTTYGANSYAVVTGATSDSGRAYCDHLAKQGLNLILVDED